ncbi:hypothetical protein [Thiorhodovibrio frisius]|uniref:hypothetical protein n=1 Tax=Thiorhodovibrio frisius TaxID=631362 RepID=UPI000255EC06|nr:hypothetical protein [Thiorhodovibrio frisius]
MFTYSEHIDAAAHCEAITELMRVSGEVRVFPLLTLAGAESAHLPAVIDQAEASGWRAEILTVDYQFQRRGNRMLRLSAPPMSDLIPPEESLSSMPIDFLHGLLRNAAESVAGGLTIDARGACHATRRCAALLPWCFRFRCACWLLAFATRRLVAPPAKEQAVS